MAQDPADLGNQYSVDEHLGGPLMGCTGEAFHPPCEIRLLHAPQQARQFSVASLGTRDTLPVACTLDFFRHDIPRRRVVGAEFFPTRCQSWLQFWPVGVRALFARDPDDCEQQMWGDVRWHWHASELRRDVLNRSERTTPKLNDSCAWSTPSLPLGHVAMLDWGRVVTADTPLHPLSRQLLTMELRWNPKQSAGRPRRF